MRKEIKYIPKLMILMLFPAMEVISQDLHFSQFNYNPVSYNPGAAGAFSGQYRLTSSYKNQWRSVSTPFKTIFASYDMPIYLKGSEKNHLGAAVSFYSDKAGSANMGLTKVDGDISYSLNLAKKRFITFGARAGYNQRSMNASGLKWDSQYSSGEYDPNMPTGEAVTAGAYSYFDYAGGMYYRQKRRKDDEIIGGFSVLHLNRPVYSFAGSGDRLALRYVLQGSYQYMFRDAHSYLIPSFSVMSQRTAMEIMAGTMYERILGMDSKYTGENVSSSVSLGGYYRLRDAIVAVFRYDYKHMAAIGISYDINISGLTRASTGRGGFELSLVWKGYFNREKAMRKNSVRFN